MKATLFGLTGGIASGKSTVAKIFASCDIQTVDADQLSREVMAPGQQGYDYTVSIFGDEILHKDGLIDRKLLGSKLFSKRSLKRTFERRMWEYIQERAWELFETMDGPVCYEASMLVESGLWTLFRPLVVVMIPPEVQIERLMARNGFTRNEAKQRIAAQKPGNAIARADYLIRNDGDEAALRSKALDFLSSKAFLDRCRLGHSV